MAKTFYLESQKYEGRYMYISCTQTPDILTNTSKIDWTFVSTGGEATYYATGPTVVKINGQQVFYAEMMGWTARKFPTAKGSVSGSLTIPHNEDGTKSIEVLISTAIYYEAVETNKVTWALDKIDRFATIETAPNFNDEQNPTITYSNPAGTNVKSLRACISLDGSKDDVAYRDISKTGTSYTFYLTDAERDVLREATKGSNSRTVKFYVRSEIGSNYQGSNLARTFTIKDPKPIINPTITDSNDDTYALTGDRNKLVRYYSNAAITMGAEAVKKATLKSTKVTCGNKSLTADGTINATINAIESATFVFTATDSRGNTTTKTVTPSSGIFSSVDYIKLTCSLGNNMPDADGNMTVNVSGNYFNGSFGATSNSLNVYYRYKTAGGSYGKWEPMTATKNGNTYSATANLTGFDYQTAYVFQAYAVDVLATVYTLEKTVKATPVFDWSENDFKFNVPVSIGNLNLSGNGMGIDIPGICSDVTFTVIPLCKISTEANTACNSATQGFFYFHRINGLGGPRFLFVQAEDRYSGVSQFNMSAFGDFRFNATLTTTAGTGFRTCRFQYNGVLYGGLALYIENANFRHVSFVGRTVDNVITGIDIYNRNTSTVLNSEIYNSLEYDAGSFLDGNKTLYFNDGSLGLQAYPVNSIYIGYSHTSPASLFGGTWARIEGRVLYGCASTGTIGATGSHATGSGSSSLPYVNVAIWRRTA